MHRSILTAFACTIVAGVCASLPGQTTYGTGSPGSGGITPTIASNQPWAGRSGFSLKIDNGLGGTGGVLYVALNRLDSTFAGLPLYVDPNAVLLTQLIVLGGQQGIAGDGSLDLPLPLTTVSPQLIGIELYGQAALFDPAGPGLGSTWTATSGLACELTAVPQLFVGTSVGGSTDPAWGVNGVTRALDFAIGFGATNNVNGATYTRDGNRLFVSSGFGGVRVGDLSGGGAPVWSLVNGAIDGRGASDILVMDDERDLLWCIDGSTGVRELSAIDVKVGSPSFGSIVHSTVNLEATGGVLGSLSMDPERKLAAVVDIFGGLSSTGHILTIIDTDPNSPGFLQIARSSQIPPGTLGSFTLDTGTGFSPDGTHCYVLRQNAGSIPGELAVLEIASGLWMDFNPASPAIDHIGPSSTTPVSWGSALTDLEVAADGSIFVCGLGGSGTAGRLQVNGTSTTWTPVIPTSPIANAWKIGLNRDGTVLALGVGENLSVTPTRAIFFDAATLVEIDSVTLGSSAAPSTMAWR